MTIQEALKLYLEREIPTNTQHRMKTQKNHSSLKKNTIPAYNTQIYTQNHLTYMYFVLY